MPDERDQPKPITGDAPTLAAETPAVGSADTVEASTTRPPTLPSLSGLAAGSYIPGGIALATVDPGSYDVSGEFARGGLGRILKAKDRRLGRHVAIKELLRSRGRAAERFIREALVTARLQHPAIVPVYEAGHWPTGEPFYAMKLVNGRSLDQVIAEAKDLNARLALLPVIIDVCEAVAYAHSEKIIHRDLKPANVLVGSFGETVVIDWGLAKDLSIPEAAEEADEENSELLSQSPQHLTAVGSVMGTPAFMPPEQAMGKSVDERADVYALGAMLYYLLAGLAPYGGNSSTEILKNVLTGPPLPLEGFEAEIPLDLLAIVKKAMAREVIDRYPTAKELSADMKRFQTGMLVAAHNYSPLDHTRRFIQRHKIAISVAVLMFLLILSGGFFGFVAIMKERDRANLDLLTAMGHAAEAEIERLRAELAQARADANADDLIMAEVKASLLQDPTQTLAWLKRLSDKPERFETVRFFAAEAYARGTADSFPLQHEPRALSFTADAKTIILVDKTQAQLFDVASKQLSVLQPSPGANLQLLACSPDDTQVAISADDFAIYVMSLQDKGKPPLTLKGHSRKITQLRYLPGQRLVSSGDDGLLLLWDLSDPGLSAKTLAKLPLPIASFDANPEGDLFALVSGEALSMLSLKTPPNPPKLTVNAVSVVRFSPDGSMLAVGGKGGLLRLWRLSAKPSEIPLAGFAAQTIEALAFSQDGARLAAGGQTRTVVVWSTATATVESRIRVGHPIQRLHFSDDGNVLSGAGDHAFIFLWDSALQEMRLLSGHKDPVSAFGVSSDGRLVASGSEDGTLRLWKEPIQERQVFRAPQSSTSVLAAFGEHRFASSSADNSILLWDTHQKPATSVPLRGHADEVLSLAFSRDGARLASASVDGTIKLWSTATHLEERTLRGHTDAVNRVLFLADEQRLASSSYDGTLRLWSLSDDTSRVLTGHSGIITALALSPDGAVLASAGSADQTIRLWSPVGEPLATLSGHTKEITSLAFSPDGKWLASASQDQSVLLWDVAQGARIGAPLLHNEVVSILTFSPNGTRLATGSDDNLLRLWDLRANPMTAKALRGHQGVINALVFSPDGHRLASGAFDETLRSWDVQSGESRVLFQGVGSVWSIAYSASGDALAASCAEGVVFWKNLLPRNRAEFAAWLLQSTNLNTY